MTRFRSSIFFLMIFSAFLLPDQQPVLADSNEYRFDSWTSDDGLPQNSVYSILQTSDGYLWFTTLDGLVRYDGVRFKVFNKANSKGINSNRFAMLFEDSDKTLWIGTEDGGLTRYRDGKFTTYTTEDGLFNNQVGGIGETDAGELLVRTHRGLVRYQDGRFVTVSADIKSFAASIAYKGRSGASWYWVENRLRRIKDGSVTDYELPDSTTGSRNVIALYEDREGRLWIATTQADLLMLKDEKLTVYGVKDGFPATNIRAFCEDRDGALWIATLSSGLVRFQDGRFTTFTTEDGLPLNQMRTIYLDREGTLWAGTNSRGLVRINKRIIKAYLPGGGRYDNSIYPILEDRAGNIWIGGGSLYRFKDGVFHHIWMRVMALYEDKDGRIWLGTGDGPLSFKDGKFTDETALLTDLGIKGGINAILMDGQGTLWFGTRWGLVGHKDGNSRRYGKEDGLQSEEIRALLEDREGDLWIGTYGGLARFHKGRFTSYTETDGLSSNRIRSLYEDGEGTLWIGTYDGGLNRFKDGRFTRYTTEEGMSSNGVFQILEDDAGNFWMSGNQGIQRVSRQQLNDFAEGKIAALTSVSYGVADGMRVAECNGGRQPAGIVARDGRLWFPTVEGVVVVDPKGISFNPLPPPVLIENVLINRKDAAFKDGLEIPAGQQNLEIRYTGLSFIRPESLRFRYKLEGLDADWIEAGDRRAVFYSYIPAGEYTFKVIAANKDGVWNEEGAAIRIRVIPPLWQRSWFQALVILSLVGVAAILYRLRIKSLKRMHAMQEAFSRRVVSSQEQERKRIAAELHDSLGQSLIMIINRARMSLKRPAPRSDMLEQMEGISATASAALEEVKEISYNLRPYLLDRLGLARAVESMIKKVSNSTGLDFETDIDSLDDVFSKESEIVLYRIIQECVNNIVKHAQAKRAKVIIKKDASGLRLTIQDDGKGFDPSKINSSETAKRSFGLFGITERTRLLGGRPSIESHPGRGTTITINIALKDGRHEG
ncbi:MAG: histidine kinase [Blastocatellia bacterium]|nr:histidine kinase [Blastocatellia bacterium]